MMITSAVMLGGDGDDVPRKGDKTDELSRVNNQHDSS